MSEWTMDDVREAQRAADEARRQYHEDEGLAAVAGAATDEMVDGIELAWGIIANVDGGNLTKQSDDWQDAVRRWADRFLPLLGRALAERARRRA